MGGGAVTLAAQDLRQKIAETVASGMSCLPGDLEFRDEQIVHPTSGQSIPFDKAIQEMFSRQKFPHAFRLALAVVAARPERLLVAQGARVLLSDDGGASFVNALASQLEKMSQGEEFDASPAAIEARRIEVAYDPIESAARALRLTWETSALTLRMMGRMLTGELSWKNISGPWIFFHRPRLSIIPPITKGRWAPP